MRMFTYDLKDFSTWLVKHKQVNKRTAAVYCSQVRSFLSNCAQPDDPSQGEVDVFFQALEDKPATNLLSSWRKYTEWVRDTTGRVLPDYNKPKKAKSTSKVSSEAELPLDVTAALYFCIRTCELRLIDVEKIMWINVSKGRLSRKTFVKVKTSDKYALTLPDECIEVFRNFAQPETPYAPLIPWYPGCPIAMSVKKLKQELVIYEKKLVRAGQQGEKLDCFDPFAVCQAEPVVDRTQLATTPTTQQVVRPLPQPDLDSLQAKLDVPVSQAITTADLLARLVPAPKKNFVIDFNDIDRRTTDYPGDWRYLYDEDLGKVDEEDPEV